MEILQKPVFMRAYKKLTVKQRIEIDEAIRKIINEPLSGKAKAGDLAGVRVYKFHIVRQLTLLAYLYDEQAYKLTLVAFGPHENFYRDLEKS